MALKNFTRSDCFDLTSLMTEDIPRCPSCNVKMRVAVIALDVFSADVDQITHICECGSEEIRYIKGKRTQNADTREFGS